VLPEAQGLGTGRALIDQGLASLRALGAQGCVVLGEPLLYGRFGFVHDPALVLQGVRQAFFLSLSFGPISARGEVTYHAGFSAVS
jgi:putative acetyltransferase